jgi:hypothetical protein
MRQAARLQLKREPLGGVSPMARTLTLVALFTASACRAPAPVTAPKLAATFPDSWEIMLPPDPDSEAALCANHADTTWHVSLSPDSSTVLAWPDTIAFRSDSLDLGDGQIIAYDRGEFGGTVLWKPVATEAVPIASENVRFLLRAESGVYALAGLAHLGDDEGRLLRFVRRGVLEWKVDTIADLGSAPDAFTYIGHDSLLVATPSGIVLVHLAGSVRRVAESRGWWLTYPHSIVRDRAGVIYVGMRLAVARLTPGPPYEETWLVPAGCGARERIPERLTGCRCAPVS